jgi:hypothetical protein
VINVEATGSVWINTDSWSRIKPIDWERINTEILQYTLDVSIPLEYVQMDFTVDPIVTGDMSARKDSFDEELPDFLRRPEEMARCVYDFWVGSMDSDGMNHMFPSQWTGLGEEERSHLMESLQVNVIEPMRRYWHNKPERPPETQKRQEEVTIALDDGDGPGTHVDQANGNGHDCYVCGNVGVSERLGVCSGCKSYVRG